MEYYEEWENVARTEEAHKAIASENWQNEEYYNMSGIISISRFAKIVEQYYKENCKNLTVVEIGCGTGRETKYLADCFQLVFGLDAAESMISKAEQRVKRRNVAFMKNEAGMIPLADDTIDIVYSFIVFQHCKFETVLSYFREAKRVLKRDGRFIFQLGTDKNKDYEPSQYNDVGVRRKETLIKDLESAGFEIESISDDHFGLHIAKKK